jgi:hypothetical protein
VVLRENEPSNSEPDWWPAPRSDPWPEPRPRVLQVLVLHALALGVPLVLGILGAVSWKKTALLVGSQVPALVLVWVGLFAYFRVRSAERAGGSAERGRMLVVATDVMATIFAVGGFFFWLAILAN